MIDTDPLEIAIERLQDAKAKIDRWNATPDPVPLVRGIFYVGSVMPAPDGSNNEKVTFHTSSDSPHVGTTTIDIIVTPGSFKIGDRIRADFFKL